MANGLATPALIDPSDLHRVWGRAMVNRARYWPRNGEGLVPVRPHVAPQHVQDVLVSKTNPAIVQDGEHRVVVHRLHQELLGLVVVLGSMICSPQEHSEQERRRLVALPGRPIVDGH